MAYFECSRCGYESQRKADFFRHLRRKYPCSPKLQDIPVEDVFRKHFNYKSQVESTGWMEFVEKMTPIDPKRPILTPIDPSPHSPSKPTKLKKYQCTGCKKHFSKNCHMRRHEKKCSKKKYLDKLED